MEPGLIALGLIAVCFFALKRRRWPPTVWNHESFCWLPYWTYGNSFLSYFRYFAMPLGMFLPAISYGRSIRCGRACYDALLTFTGLTLGLVAIILSRQFGFSAIVAPLSALAFYYCVFMPLVTTEGVEPEIYGYAFAAFGFLLTCLGLHTESVVLILIGCIVAGVAIWAKISIAESLWSPLAVLVMHGADLLFVACCIVFLLVLAIYAVLVVLGVRTSRARSPKDSADFFEILRRFFVARRRDMKIRTGAGGGAKLFSLAGDVAIHFLKLAPLLAGYIVFMVDPAFSSQLKSLTALMIAVSLLHPMARLHFHPIYVFLSCFPLALGTSLALNLRWVWLTTHPWWAAFGGILLLLWAVVTLRPGPVHRNVWEKTALIKREIIDPLAETIQPGHWIFQDGYTVMLYLALGCRGPGRQFLWMNYAEQELVDEQNRKRLINYFRINRPAYYFAQRRRINLSVIEEYTGLRYEILKAGYIYAYRLRETVAPHTGTPAYEELFAGAGTRFAADRKTCSGEDSTKR